MKKYLLILISLIVMLLIFNSIILYLYLAKNENNLGSKNINSDKNPIYKSENQKIKEYSLYIFIGLFALILIYQVLIWMRK